jgi:hypothetical protein
MDKGLFAPLFRIIGIQRRFLPEQRAQTRVRRRKPIPC